MAIALCSLSVSPDANHSVMVVTPGVYAPSGSLIETVVSVAPGAARQCRISVRNPSLVVAQGGPDAFPFCDETLVLTMLAKMRRNSTLSGRAGWNTLPVSALKACAQECLCRGDLLDAGIYYLMAHAVSLNAAEFLNAGSIA